MTRKKELILIFLSDFIFINLAWIIYYYFRIESGWIKFITPPSFLTPMLVIYLYWVLIFYIKGLYKQWFSKPRFDEIASVFKAVSIGCIILFFVIFLDDYLKDAKVISRFLILIYWGLMISLTGLGRFLIRGFQLRLLENGIGLKHTIIVGDGNKAVDLKKMICKQPKLGYKFCGIVTLENASGIEDNIGKLQDIREIINRDKIEVIIVATEQNVKHVLTETLNYTSDENVTVKIIPEVYEVIVGMANTQQVNELPLVEVNNELDTGSSKMVKKAFDNLIPSFVIVLLSPLIVITAIIVKLTKKDPAFFVKDIKEKKKNG